MTCFGNPMCTDVSADKSLQRRRCPDLSISLGTTKATCRNVPRPPPSSSQGKTGSETAGEVAIKQLALFLGRFAFEFGWCSAGLGCCAAPLFFTPRNKIGFCVKTSGQEAWPRQHQELGRKGRGIGPDRGLNAAQRSSEMGSHLGRKLDRQSNHILARSWSKS